MYTCFRCARNLYYANIFCRGLPRSKCYSSKTCLMCIICALKYLRCSNKTMNNTSTLIRPWHTTQLASLDWLQNSFSPKIHTVTRWDSLRATLFTYRGIILINATRVNIAQTTRQTTSSVPYMHSIMCILLKIKADNNRIPILLSPGTVHNK